MFLVYINDLTEGLFTNAKLFANCTILLSIIHDTQTSKSNFNKDLEIISNCVFQWKMNFNLGLIKQALDVTLSSKTK